MEIAEQLSAQRQVQSLKAEDVEARNYDMSIVLGYSIFAIVFLTMVYFDSVPAGTASVDFASMTVFP